MKCRLRPDFCKKKRLQRSAGCIVIDFFPFMGFLVFKRVASMEKDILQSLKLEISKNFTLTPYERIAFHKILAFRKSDNGLKFLLRDLLKGGLVRRSAISVLKDFTNPEVAGAFLDIIATSEDLTSDEFYDIMEHVERNGTKDHLPAVREYITKFIEKTEQSEYVARAVFVLGRVGSGDQDTMTFIRDIIENTTMFERVRSAAVESFVHDFSAELMESLLRENNDKISLAVFRSIAEIADREMLRYEESSEDEIFTVMPGQDDRVLLDIRVLLGKMSPFFDRYSRETKASYIMAMIMSGHREFIVYTMKALTSNDPELIDQTLYVILANTGKLRQPDKLLRSLISLPSVTSRDTKIIVEIFHRFFALMKDSRNNGMFRDKIYNYLIVTLDTYFETYRKNFMIPEIMEKDHLPDVQAVRSLILNRFNPEIKRRIINYLHAEDRTGIKKILSELAESVSFIDESDERVFGLFVEMLFDNDLKSREISAARIGDIDYEKRYMKNRIVRICEVIARLGIDEASANLVKMFNYVKKYYDEEIYRTVTQTLSALNYPYMLGELEVQLASGDASEKMRAVQLLPFFNEQRSLNIMLDYVREHLAEKNEIVTSLLNVLVKREVAGNVAVNEIAKAVVKGSPEPSNRRLGVQLIGHCGFDGDIDYLHELFLSETDAGLKESIVQSFDLIMQIAREFDKQKAISCFKEYMKDPGIRVRMYSCAILLKLGNQDALVSIREMMVIKNRQIQRDILLVLGTLMTAEIAFFLISLLKEDYAISADIIPLLGFLKPEELTEVDHFVVNLFKKFEGVQIEGISGAASATRNYEGNHEIKGYLRESSSILILDIVNYETLVNSEAPIEMTLVIKRGYQLIVDIVGRHGGTISRSTAGKLVASFHEVVSASYAAQEILAIIQQFNAASAHSNPLVSVILVGIADADFVNSEIIIPVEREFRILRAAPVENRVFFTGKTARVAELSFRCGMIPESLFPMSGITHEFRELISVSNFQMKADNVLKKLYDEEERRLEEQRLFESGAQQVETGKRSKNTAAFSSAMESVGKILRRELSDISKYVGKRSTDRELIKTVERMTEDAYRRYMLEVSKTVID
jgi:HEAT repeat protein